uniref:Uncharacterized protein n=1 Tax=Gopherus evgoodei TaxID=1825980 RepID=A0A8C4YD14_9SAUR
GLAGKRQREGTSHHMLLPGLANDGARKQQCILHYSGVGWWGPAHSSSRGRGRPYRSGASGPLLGARPVLPGWAVMGMLALPEGPELLDRKQRSKQVLDSPDSNLLPSPTLVFDVSDNTLAWQCV